MQNPVLSPDASSMMEKDTRPQYRQRKNKMKEANEI
jgi:hypothetical protein